MQTWNVNVERQFGPAPASWSATSARRATACASRATSISSSTACGRIPPLSASSADPARDARSATSPRSPASAVSHYKGLWLTANHRPSQRSAVQRLVHAVEVDRHQLAELAGRGRRPEQLRHRRQRGTVGLRCPPPLRRQRDLRAAVQGQPAGRRLAARLHLSGPDRQPDQHRHQHQHLHRREQHAATRPGRRS